MIRQLHTQFERQDRRPSAACTHSFGNSFVEQKPSIDIEAGCSTWLERGLGRFCRAECVLPPPCVCQVAYMRERGGRSCDQSLTRDECLRAWRMPEAMSKAALYSNPEDFFTCEVPTHSFECTPLPACSPLLWGVCLGNNCVHHFRALCADEPASPHPHGSMSLRWSVGFQWQEIFFLEPSLYNTCGFRTPKTTCEKFAIGFASNPTRIDRQCYCSAPMWSNYGVEPELRPSYSGVSSACRCQPML